MKYMFLKCKGVKYTCIDNSKFKPFIYVGLICLHN